MFIRGIDPSRRNVIVGGGGAEGASPHGALQELQRRDMLVARVLAVSGAEATLDVEGQRVVVETHVALTAGDKLYVRVQESAGRGLKLTLLANEPANGRSPALTEESIDDVLVDLGFPVDDRTRAAARALAARDGALTRASLQAFFDAIAKFPRLGTQAYGQAALLQRLGVSLSPESLALMASRAAPESGVQLLGQIRGLTVMLEGLRRGGALRAAQRGLLDEVLSILGGIPLDEGKKPAQVTAALERWVKQLWPPPVEEGSQGGGGRSGAPDDEEAAVRGSQQDESVLRRLVRSGTGSGLIERLGELSRQLGARHTSVQAKIGETVSELLFSRMANGGLNASSGVDAVGVTVVPLLLNFGAGHTGEARMVAHAQERPEGQSPEAVVGMRVVLVVPSRTLGMVQVELRVEGENLSVMLGAQEEAAVESLGEHLPELRERLSRQAWRVQRCGARKLIRIPEDPFVGLGMQQLVHFDRRV